MSQNQDQAVQKLTELKTLFAGVAADLRKPKFFQSWLDRPKQEANVIDSFAGSVSQVIEDIAATNISGAKNRLEGLKSEFDDVAKQFDAQTKGFFTSWFGEAQKKASEYRGYSAKVSEVLNLI